MKRSEFGVEPNSTLNQNGVLTLKLLILFSWHNSFSFTMIHQKNEMKTSKTSQRTVLY